jgi:hypothetical protein
VAGIGLFLFLKHVHLDEGAACFFVYLYINIAAILAAFLYFAAWAVIFVPRRYGSLYDVCMYFYFQVGVV